MQERVRGISNMIKKKNSNNDNRATYPQCNQYDRNRNRYIIYNSVGCFLTEGVELGGHILEPKSILPLLAMTQF